MNNNVPNVPNNVFFFFKDIEALFSYARKHPELNFSVFGETRKGWLNVSASPRDVNNSNTSNVTVEGTEVEAF